jgi:hypothetical protein
MAILWSDGFDHYGTDENNMTDGAYATWGAAPNALSTTRVATGTRSFFVDEEPGIDYAGALRKVLPTPVSKMGAMARFYFEGLPTGNTGGTIFDFLTSTPTSAHISVLVDANGCLRFIRGRNYISISGAETGTLIATSDPVIVANAFNHIEVQVYIHDTAGWVRASVNNVHRFEATGLDTKNGSSTTISSVGQTTNVAGAANPKGFYIDDYILYDFTGDSAVDTDFCPTVDGSGVATSYINELDCYYLPPTADTVEADWLKSTGTDGYALVDETTPNDADYIYSTTAGDLTEFDLTDLPEEITYIRGLQLIGRMSKTDSGVAMIKYGVHSDAATDDADERPVTVEPTYWWDWINVDPDSLSRWTRTSLNAAKIRITRTV